MRLADMAERSFARHETFHPRYGWFRKAYAFVADEGNDFNQEDAPIIIGVGKNMVRAIRFSGLASVSGHKICGPGGVGALVGARHALQRLAPVIHGGGHERGLRSGSLNVGGIVGLGAAARIAVDERESESARVEALRDRLVTELGARLAGVHQNGDPSRRLPNTASVYFEGADAEAVMSNMDPVAVSTGSACSAGSIEPSEVLTAMGLSRDAAFESVRFSLGRFTTEADIDAAVEGAVASVERVRAMTA